MTWLFGPSTATYTGRSVRCAHLRMIKQRGFSEDDFLLGMSCFEEAMRDYGAPQRLTNEIMAKILPFKVGCLGLGAWGLRGVPGTSFRACIQWVWSFSRYGIALRGGALMHAAHCDWRGPHPCPTLGIGPFAYANACIPGLTLLLSVLPHDACRTLSSRPQPPTPGRRRAGRRRTA